MFSRAQRRIVHVLLLWTQQTRTSSSDGGSKALSLTGTKYSSHNKYDSWRQCTCVPGSVPPGGASFPNSFRLRCAVTRPGCTCSPPPEASPPSTVPVGNSVTHCRGMGGFWWDLRRWREQRATFITPPDGLLVPDWWD